MRSPMLVESLHSAPGEEPAEGCQAWLAPPALRMVGEDTSPHTAPAGVSPEQGTAAAR